jgi:phenylacetate-CoA ligase
MRAYQTEQLRRLVSHAFENVPYYRAAMRERKLIPADIHGVEDLQKLPIVTRKDLKERGHEFVDQNRSMSSLIEGNTSGTSGSPLRLYYDRDACAAKNAVDWRQKAWAEVKLGDPIALFTGRMTVPVGRAKPPFWRHNMTLNQLLFSILHLSHENARAYLRKLESFKPVAVEGFPSTLYAMAMLLSSQNRTFPVKAAFTTSEMLHAAQRQAIERVFQCKVFDYYGMAERVVFATECEHHTGLHVNADFGIAEVLKEQNEPARPGERGRLVATGLHNYSMPLIRYRTSDVTAIEEATCSCGRAFPLMTTHAARDVDIITTPDGRLISAAVLDQLIKSMESVAESQLVQEELNRLRFCVVRGSAYKEEDMTYLVRQLKYRLGEDMKIEVEFMESLPSSPSGKFRWVTSKVPLAF